MLGQVNCGSSKPTSQQSATAQRAARFRRSRPGGQWLRPGVLCRVLAGSSRPRLWSRETRRRRARGLCLPAWGRRTARHGPGARDLWRRVFDQVAEWLRRPSKILLKFGFLWDTGEVWVQIPPCSFAACVHRRLGRKRSEDAALEKLANLTGCVGRPFVQTGAKTLSYVLSKLQHFSSLEQDPQK